MSSSPVCLVDEPNAAVTIVPADASNLKTILTAAGTFYDVTTLSVCSDDTSARVLSFYVTISGTDYLIGSVNIPTLAGTDGTTSAVNILASALFTATILDAFSNRILQVETGNLLKCKSLTTVTTAKTITIFSSARKF